MADKTKDSIQIKRTQDTLSRKVETDDLIQILDAMRLSGKQVLPAEKILQMLVQEGRSDLGSNGADRTQPKVVARTKELMDLGATFRGADTVSNIEDKQRVAQRLGIPFDSTWNGTGRVDSKAYGIKGTRSSKDYVAESKQQEAAYTDPANTGALDLIQRGLNGTITPNERATTARTEYPSADKSDVLGKLGLPDPNTISSLYSRESDDAYRVARAAVRDSWNRAAGRTIPGSYDMNTLASDVYGHQLSKQGVDSAATRRYERNVSNSPEHASLVGTVVAKGEQPPPISEPSVLDKILSYFK